MTAFPEAPPVALSSKVPDPRALSESASKVIVWVATVKVNVMFADVAEL